MMNSINGLKNIIIVQHTIIENSLMVAFVRTHDGSVLFM